MEGSGDDEINGLTVLLEVVGFMLAGGFLAFLLLVAEMKLLQLTSSLTMGIFGTAKEVLQAVFFEAHRAKQRIVTGSHLLAAVERHAAAVPRAVVLPERELARVLRRVDGDAAARAVAARGPRRAAAATPAAGGRRRRANLLD